MRKFLDTIGKHMSATINPWIVAAIGPFSVLWGFYLYIPKKNVSTMTYPLFVDYHFREFMFLFAVSLGVWLFSVPIWAQKISRMILPLRIMSVFWLFVAVFTGVSNWTSNTVLTYVFLSFFCIVTSANFSVNRDHPEYRNIFKSSY